jgi:hypothetical protein
MIPARYCRNFILHIMEQHLNNIFEIKNEWKKKIRGND